MEQDIRALFAKYSICDIHQFITNELQIIYKYVSETGQQSQQPTQEIKENKVITTPSQTNIPLQKPDTPLQITSKKIVKKLLPSVKESPPIIDIGKVDLVNNKFVATEQLDHPVNASDTPESTNIIDTVTHTSPDSDTKVYPPRETKAEHIIKVKLKREELVAQNINPESLLTDDNLKKWINDNWSYQKIAKETGCKDTVISSKCKALGLKSKADLARNIIASRNNKH